MRMLESSSPRVKVYSIGKTEEGREMIAVAVSSEANIAKVEANRAQLAKLADPRDQPERRRSGEDHRRFGPGLLHHRHDPFARNRFADGADGTGVPAGRRRESVRQTDSRQSDHPHYAGRRSRRRDRQVDVYRWHLANPGKNWPGLIYWGKYVAHDNNRDAMALSLQLTRNVLNTFIGWKAQVLHDLHESVPYLYDNTVGDQPYNAWIDPILADEWHLIGWYNVGEMTKFGMPGVFTHGTFDTWSPSYLMFIAASHNGISRLYETFGNAGADTVERTLSPSEYSRTWYRQNPPLPRAKWSQRNNNNYQQTGLSSRSATSRPTANTSCAISTPRARIRF